eukprot:366559-Chlamydomonas_euryale.AAC.13
MNWLPSKKICHLTAGILGKGCRELKRLEGGCVQERKRWGVLNRSDATASMLAERHTYQTQLALLPSPQPTAHSTRSIFTAAHAHAHAHALNCCCRTGCFCTCSTSKPNVLPPNHTHTRKAHARSYPPHPACTRTSSPRPPLTHMPPRARPPPPFQRTHTDTSLSTCDGA